MIATQSDRALDSGKPVAQLRDRSATDTMDFKNLRLAKNAWSG